MIIFALPRSAKVLYEERNGFKRFGAANGGTLLSRSYFLKERKCARFTSEKKTKKLLEWVNNLKIHGSVSSLLRPFSHHGKVNILEEE